MHPVLFEEFVDTGLSYLHVYDGFKCMLFDCSEIKDPQSFVIF